MTQQVEKKVWTRDEINALINRSDAAVERAMVVLFERQTTDEQRSEDTKHQNSVGFSAAHARTGSYLAKWVLSGKHLNGRFLDRARHIALLHSKQLVEEANR